VHQLALSISLLAVAVLTSTAVASAALGRSNRASLIAGGAGALGAAALGLAGAALALATGADVERAASWAPPIGGLAAVCFIKAFGIAFLDEPRTEAASGATESG